MRQSRVRKNRRNARGRTRRGHSSSSSSSSSSASAEPAGLADAAAVAVAVAVAAAVTAAGAAEGFVSASAGFLLSQPAAPSPRTASEARPRFRIVFTSTPRKRDTSARGPNASVFRQRHARKGCTGCKPTGANRARPPPPIV